MARDHRQGGYPSDSVTVPIAIAIDAVTALIVRGALPRVMVRMLDSQNVGLWNGGPGRR
jgi:hypothetical protein